MRGGPDEARLPKGVYASVGALASNSSFDRGENRITERAPDTEAEQGARMTIGAQSPHGVRGVLTPRLNGDAGASLPQELRVRLEAGLGRDLSRIRIHTDDHAAQANRDFASRAFTQGSNIYFGAGEYASGSAAPTNLLLHELVHVAQQGLAPATGTSELGSVPPIHSCVPTVGVVQRKQDPNAFRQKVFVVRDPSIGAGGTVVSDLLAFKRQVMKLKNTGDWTLVLAIHGSLDRLASQSPPDWQKNAIFYTKDDVESLFADPEWISWRDTYGPSYLSLTSCQVSIGLERTMIGLLTRNASGGGSQATGPTQAAQGLGTGCKPLSTTITYRTETGKAIRTRKEYGQLPKSEKAAMLEQLAELNAEFGYYGAPPVSEGKILDYYFDEEPKGGWAKVQVGLAQGAELVETEIPFWNRSSGPNATRFHQMCDQGVGQLGTHTPRAPGLRSPP